MTNYELNNLIAELLSPLRDNCHNWGAIRHRKMFRFLQENLRINHNVTDNYNSTEIRANVEIKDENGYWQPIFETPQPIVVKKPTKTQAYQTDLGITIPPLDLDQYS